MRLDFLPVDSLAKIAWTLVDVHGEGALGIADRTIMELQDEGEDICADAWRGLRSLIEDVVEGRLGRGEPTVH